MNQLNHYEILQIRPEATEEVVRAAYRALVKKHHPDAGGDQQMMKRINEAYEVLSDPQRRAAYDRACRAQQAARQPSGEQSPPGGGPGPNQNSSPGKSQSRGPHPGRHPGPGQEQAPPPSMVPKKPASPLTVAAVAGGALLLMALINAAQQGPDRPSGRAPVAKTSAATTSPVEKQETPRLTSTAASTPVVVTPPPPVESSVAPPTVTEATAPKPTPAVAETASPSDITLGSTREQVRQIMGTPDTVIGDTWSYKYSSVYFDGTGRVRGWANISHNLPLYLGERDPNAVGVTIGSTRDQVLAAMGTPDTILGDSWGYGYSLVYFDATKRVRGWANISHNLRLYLGDRDPNAVGVTIGSTRDQVLAAMGTPDSILGDSWGYGYSLVYFDATKRVRGWANISHNLKLQ